MLYTDEEKDKKPDFKKYDRSYWVIGKRDYRQYSITISQNFPSTLIKQRITNKKPDATEWRQIIRIMLTDTEFKTFYIKHLPYINAIYIGAIERLKKRSSSYNPLDENLRDATKISINYRYIETNLNMNASTFKEAIENKNYIENECWINTIRDFYKDDLLSNKCRKHITRETILNDIGMTEETIKKGISLNTIGAF